MNAADRRNAQALLIAAMRSEFAPDGGARLVAATKPGVDWQQFMSSAVEHKLVPLVARVLAGQPSADVPTHVRREFARYASSCRLNNRFLLDELHRLVTGFAAIGVRAIPFKGPTLSVMLWDEPGMRDPGDLDLLVSERDYPRARSALLAQGYSMVHGPRHERVVRQAQMKRADGRVDVDLHWALAPRRFLVDMDARHVWSDVQRATLAGHAFEVLSPTLTLNMLCLQGAKERWTRLDRICDVARLVRTRPDMDWALAGEQAAAFGPARYLRLGLALAAEVAGQELPDQARRDLEADRRLGELVAYVEQCLRDPQRVENDPVHPAHRFQALLTDSRWRRLGLWCRHGPKYLSRLFRPTSADYQWVRLPRPLRPAYVLVRPVRLLAKYGSGFLGDLRRMVD